MTFDASELAEFTENIMNIDILHGACGPTIWYYRWLGTHNS